MVATSDPEGEVASPRSRRRRRLLLLLATLAAISLGAGQLSLALFTDQETVAGTFSTGSIVLDDVKIDALTLTTATIMPGDTVTDDVVVENDGTAQLRYSMSTTSTNADLKSLRDVLTLTVRGIDATLPATPCDNFDGTLVLAATVLGTNTAKFGDVTRRFAGRRPHAERGGQRDALLPRFTPRWDRQCLPERHDDHHVHLRRRADGQ